MLARHAGLLAALALGGPALVGGCASSGAAQVTQPGPVEGRLRTADGVELHYRLAGAPQGKVVLFLHDAGGSALPFERTAGEELEARLRVLYLDQRGSGRSGRPPPEALGWKQLVSDVEALRAHLEIEHLGLIGHGLGGVLALEYLRLHRTHVDSLVLVDATPDVEAALEHQARRLVEVAGTAFPRDAEQLEKISRGDIRPSDKVLAAEDLVRRRRFDRALFFATDKSQARVTAWDKEVGQQGSERTRLYERLADDGFLDAHHRELLRAAGVPGLVVVGRKSGWLGERLAAETAKALELPLLWFDESAHYPFVEEPARFADKVLELLAPAPTAPAK